MRKQKKQTTQSKISKERTNICKICFKNIDFKGLFNIFNAKSSLCSRCQNKLIAKFHTFVIQDVKAIAIYDYDEHIKQLIYLLKGCYDIELSAIFLNKYINELRALYHDHIIVPAPSSLGDDEHRGFNHVVEIFRVLNLSIARNIVKKFEFKQSDLNFENRNKIRDKLLYVENVSLYGKNVLIVDDVCTTGSTLKAIVEIVKCYQPKRISILVIAKVISSFD